MPTLQQQLEKTSRENEKLKKEIKQLEHDKVQYLQNVSHQLVAPLNAIKWHIENLNSRHHSEERTSKILRSIYSQATIAVHLAKNFALMSNLEADHDLTAMQGAVTEESLFRLLVNLADDFQPLAWDKQIRIKVVNDPLESAPKVMVMRALISQALSNMIENAVKYSVPRTEIMIDGRHQLDNSMVVVRIKNKGFGWRPEETTRLFERGYRSKQAAAKHPAGTGFGLYIAKRIVTIHSGIIDGRVDDEGSAEFVVALPVAAVRKS